jgi:hypothetical protein
MCMKSLETRTDQDNTILGQNFSIFGKVEKFVSIFHTVQNFSISEKLEKFVVISYTGVIFPWLEKIIKPK